MNRSTEKSGPTDTKGTDRAWPEGLIDFVFEMLSYGPDPTTGGATAEESATASSGREERPWVLSIDDDKDYLDAMKLRLEAHEVAVMRADDGTEGYRKAFLYPPSAILLDYEMPAGRGDYVLRRLKETPATQDIPVIVITGVRDNTVKRKMLNMGAANYFTKPVPFNTVRNELAKYIEPLKPSGKFALFG